MNDTAEGVFFDVGIMIVLNAAPLRASFAPGLVRIVLRGVSDHVKSAVSSELSQRIEQNVRKRAPVETVGAAGHVERPVVEGHGADAPVRSDPLKPPRVAHVMHGGRKYVFLQESLSGLPCSH